MPILPTASVLPGLQQVQALTDGLQMPGRTLSKLYEQNCKPSASYSELETLL